MKTDQAWEVNFKYPFWEMTCPKIQFYKNRSCCKKPFVEGDDLVTGCQER